MKRLLHLLVDNSQHNSPVSHLRRRRFALFLQLLEGVSKPLTILDVGGTQRFWEVMGFTRVTNVHVTLLNLAPPKVWEPNFTGIAGDATDLHMFADKQFDIVFSNSVIEHVGSFAQQQRMAQEVQRVGQRYFVQTPNYFFPIEPHFLFPGFQWLPIITRVWLVRHFALGWHKRIPNPGDAQKKVKSIRLLKKNELLILFPNANLYEERFLGLTKSLVVYNDWGKVALSDVSSD